MEKNFLLNFLIILILVLVVYVIFYIVSVKRVMDFENLRVYECGFNIIRESRNYFSYRFFLIGILFLIFDVEIVIILPIPFVEDLGRVIILVGFVWILLIGLIYEYFYGSLSWL